MKYLIAIYLIIIGEFLMASPIQSEEESHAQSLYESFCQTIEPKPLQTDINLPTTPSILSNYIYETATLTVSSMMFGSPEAEKEFNKQREKSKNQFFNDFFKTWDKEKTKKLSKFLKGIDQNQISTLSKIKSRFCDIKTDYRYVLISEVKSYFENK
jgi:hypothetical protein